MRHRPDRVLVYVLATAALASVPLVWAVSALDLSDAGDWFDAAILFGVLYVVAEQFPIRLMGRQDAGELTASTTFGFALLIAVPLPVALLVIALGTLIGDQRPSRPKPAIRVLFNVAQVTLSFATAGAIAALARGALYVPMGPTLPFGDVAVLVPAGVAMYAVNVLLLNGAIALDQDAPFLDVLRRDIGAFDLVTHLLLLSFAPVFVIVWDHSAPLTPLLIFAIIATYRATERAVAGQHDSRHDALTGLPNRRLLDERLRELTDTAGETDRFAVMVMDLDGFKPVNDAFGHHVGDKLLVLAAERLSTVRGVDLVARIGGDEFAFVVRRATTDTELRELGGRVVATVMEPFEVDGLPIQIDASLGIAQFRDHAEDAESLLRRADSAMYAAKRSDGAVRLALESDERRGPGRLSLVADLERAVEHGELRLDYQPQLALATGAVVGLEALLRWHHPRHGVIGPARFIGTVEHTDLLASLTRHVLRRALTDARHRAEGGFDVPVSINVSARDLLDTRLPRDLADLLVEHDVVASDLTLEITESAFVADPDRATQVVGELAELGVGLAIDDFGTGYASLATLRDLPVTELKLDRSFVAGLTHGSRGASIVRAMVKLGHGLGLRVVGEGIEEPEELAELRRYGCDVGQGYLLARPLDPLRLQSYLERYGARGTDDASTSAGAGRLRLVGGAS